jgi:hypothetical protein
MRKHKGEERLCNGPFDGNGEERCGQRRRINASV